MKSQKIRRPLARSLFHLSAFLIFCLACGGDHSQPSVDDPTPQEPAASPKASTELMVHDARVSLMPNMGALYLTVHNPGAQEDRLLRVEVDLASAAETHESIDENGVMRMLARPEGFAVPAHGQLVLEPGGKHIMLMEPQEPEGETAKVVLHFERAGAVEVLATVAKMGGEGAPAMDHSMNHSIDSDDADSHQDGS